jgi:fimbrial isopeptide formation D2 family protein/LPXTG-motif cell wall-anchored protein
VIFKYWTIAPTATPAQISAIMALGTIEACEVYATANPAVLTGGTLTSATDAAGVVTVAGLAEGMYLFAETNGSALNVSEYLGVPFLLELPAMMTDGTGYFGTGANALHVYPKNVLKYPGLDVEAIDWDAGHRIGGAQFRVERYNTSTSAWETVTGVGTGGIISLASGLAVLGDLPAGQYRLINTQAPAGYLLDNRPVLFDVAAGVVSFTSTGNSPKASFTPAADPANPLLTTRFRQEPTIDKEEEVGGTQAIGDIVPWKISTTIPANIDDYVRYNITDVIDTKLDFIGTSTVVVQANSVPIPLASGVYSVAYAPGTRTLSLVFDPALLATYAGQLLTISYETKINGTAVMGEPIVNDAALDFDNGAGEDKEVKPDIPPEVWSGGARFKKIDAGTSVVLAGAEFKIATDAAGTTFLKWNADLITANSGGSFVTPVVGADIIMVSNATGLFEIKGLKGGTYYLVETKAPNVGGKQYNLLREPAAFVVTKTSYDVGSTMDVENRSGLQIPQTGGIGTAIFTIVGGALMAYGVSMYRKKNKVTTV